MKLRMGRVFAVAALVLMTCCLLGARVNEDLPAADKVLVLKSARTLSLMKKNKVYKTYKIALGLSPVGPKLMEGDNKTPEGLYKISGHNPNSQFYKSLRISYPNARDIKNAKKLGKSPGSDIMIHGLGREFGYIGKRHADNDWTWGCIAVTNEEIDEIYAAVANGTPIEIRR